MTPKLEEPPTDLGKPDRSASVTGEIEQLPPLPEETLLSPDVISPSLKVASAEKQKGMGMSGLETSKPLDDEQLLFDMLDNKEGSTEVSRDVSNEPQSQDDQNISVTVKDDKKAMVPEEDQHEMDKTEKSEGADDILAELDELDVILDAEEEEEEEGEEEEKKEEMEIHGAKLEETDTRGMEKKEMDGVKLDRTDTVDGGEKEEHQELDKLICEESDIPPDSATPKQVESENQPPVEVEGNPPEAESPDDLKSRPPETTIEVTVDNKHEPSTEVESAVPSQVQVGHVESPPEGEPKPPEVEPEEPPTMEDVKTVVPAPPSVELELQVEPGIEPVPTNVDSEQPDTGHEPQESKPESSEAKGKPPEVRPGQLELEDESQIVEPEPVGTVHEPSSVEPSEDKLEPNEDKLEPNEDKLEPQEDKPEQPEIAAKEEPGELPEEAVNTSAEPTHLSQELESTICHKEPPESSSKSVDIDASNEASVGESCGEVEKQTASSTEKQDISIDNDGRTIEDSPVKSEGQSDQSLTKSEGQSDQSPTKSEGESDQSPTRSEGENDQVVTEDDKAKSEQLLKKEDSIQESEER